ncbi:MAG: response regulator [Candidatus Jettenia caeni]|nr:MAG: response regulator [Candidatus Jettenia caeni]
MSKKGKILCIDDTPDAPEINGQTLKEILSKIYTSSPYQVIFKTDGEKGIEAVRTDDYVKLVLLDVEFKRQKKQGDTIADNLAELNPHVKVIVLTRKDERGSKISFGWKDNVVHYIVKKELSDLHIQKRFRNLCSAIIEDYNNKNWTIEYAGPGTVNLFNSQINNTYGIDIPGNFESALLECMNSLNKPVNLQRDDLSRIHNRINENIMEGTEWNTWGVLSKENCAKGQLRLVIGSVRPFQSTSSQKDPYITRSEYYEELEKLREYLEEEIIKKIKEITGLNLDKK